ncbi:MAG: zf-HC2 domain-containing protein [Actinomycetota bacterium]
MSEPDDDLTCREVVERFTEYLDGASTAGGRERIERHLAECLGCTRVLAQFRTTIEITGKLPEDPVPRDQREATRHFFLRWRETASGRS